MSKFKIGYRGHILFFKLSTKASIWYTKAFVTLFTVINIQNINSHRNTKTHTTTLCNLIFTNHRRDNKKLTLYHSIYLKKNMRGKIANETTLLKRTR